MSKIKVIELFAGVGGFRVGLEGFQKRNDSKYEVVWSNQWEPGSKLQHANMVYRYHFGKSKSIHSEVDIKTIKPETIPPHDMLVGGFPCQDFSVGALNKLSKGLEGEKGTLWYQIRRILESNKRRGKPTKYLLLENVDRLLKCPVSLKGADFLTILKNLNRMGYIVEWKVINAGDYNMPQRRRRIFILGYHKSSNLYSEVKKSNELWLKSDGVLAQAFKSMYQETIGTDMKKMSEYKAFYKERLTRDVSKLSEFDKNTLLAQDKKILSPFQNSGLLIEGKIITYKHNPVPIKNTNPMKKFLETKKKNIPEEFIVTKEQYKEKWEKARGSKKETRTSSDGLYTYTWSEGSMSEYDSIDKPARTIITSEGGSSASRTKHIIKYGKQYRRLLPSELDQLNMFKKDFTKYGLDKDGNKIEINASRRAFLMGNALVVGVISKIGKELGKRVK